MAALDLNLLDEFVFQLGCEIVDQTGNDELSVVLSTNGFGTVVEFLGVTIWSSEDDERSFVDDGHMEDYEPLEPFIREQINKMVKTLAKIKL